MLGWFQRHPGERLLVALYDNELSSARRSGVLNHLKQCRRCQRRLLQIEQNWSRLEALKSAASENLPYSEKEFVSKIQASILARIAADHTVSASQKTAAFTDTEAKRQIAAALGVYIGRRAADALLQADRTSPVSNKDGLASARSAMQILIGRKGARAIETKLHRIMSRLPESTGGSSAV